MYKKNAFIFPGQGSHYAGMGKKLYNEFPSVRVIYEEAEDSLGLHMKNILHQYTLDELERSGAVQPAIVLASYCSFKVLTEEYGIQPDFLAGHSLGEISALACSGTLSLTDALRLVHQREQIMKEASSELGGMIAVMGIDSKAAEEVCKAIPVNLGYAAISNYNSDEQVTISGNQRALDEVAVRLKLLGGGILPVSVPGPYHSRLMERSLPAIKEELDRCSFAPISIPVVSSITGTLYISESEIAEQLAIQLISPVRWTQVLATLSEQGMKDLIEVGPQAILRNLSMTNPLGLVVYAADNRDDFHDIVQMFSPLRMLETVDESSRYLLLNNCLTEALCAPNANDSEIAFEQGVLQPYRRILSDLKRMETENRIPSYREMKDGLEMLLLTLRTKQVAKAERREIVEEILYSSGLFECFHEYLNV